MEENKQNQVNLLKVTCVLSSILKQWKNILILVLMCGIGLDVFKTFMYQPLYSSSLKATLTKEENTYAQLEETLSYIDTLNYIMNGQVVQDYVKEKMNVEEIDITCHISSVNNTNVIYMQVTSDSKKEAYYALNYLVDWYQENKVRYQLPYEFDVQEKTPMNMNPINGNSHVVNFRNGCILSGGVIVVLLGCFMWLKDTIKIPQDIQNKVECRLFAKIPKEIKPRGKKFWIKKKQGILITSLKTSFYYKESIKKLRSKIEESSKKHGYKSIMITSSLENEGKSSIAANLGISLAQNGHKVLLIDADIRKPSMHKLFEIETPLSLNQYLRGKSEWYDQIIGHDKYYLHVLCARKNLDDAEALTQSKRMSQLIEEACKVYDYVIVDSSPARYLNEPVILNELVDASLLVVKQDEATVQVINETIARLTNVKNNLIGCIYNSSVIDVVKRHKVYGYRYGYSRYSRKERGI